jgi:hypothetical protein
MVVVDVKIATFGEGEPGSRCPILAKTKYVSLVHGVQTSSETHPVGIMEFPQGVKLNIHLHVALRIRMHGTIPPLPHASLWRGA